MPIRSRNLGDFFSTHRIFSSFIRESCTDALDVMMENITLYSAAAAVVAFGAAHKSVVVRAATARLLDNAVAGALGAERFMGTSREFQVRGK